MIQKSSPISLEATMASRNESGDKNNVFLDLFGVPFSRCRNETRGIGSFDEHLLLNATRPNHHNVVMLVEMLRWESQRQQKHRSSEPEASA
jgi:hypothetical protein